MIIGIIGGGASGMAAALAAAEKPGTEVLLWERQSRLGRKLQATGNGRCNLSNIHAAPAHYHGDGDFTAGALQTHSAAETMAWFEKLGLYMTVEPSGRVYPYSDQANSVVDVLRFALEHAGVEVITGAEVSRVRRVDGGFAVECGDNTQFCHRVIIACGGLAGTKLGGSMAGYRLLRNLGHHATRLRPALVQLKSDWWACPSLKGVRANCKAEIYCGQRLHSRSSGEIQFTEQGISGPVIFEVSRDVCQGGGTWKCRLDLLPELPARALADWLYRRQDTGLKVQELFTGILHNRLGRVLTAQAGLRPGDGIAELSEEQIEAVAGLAKGLDIPLTEPMGMDSAQVTAGGMVTAEFDSRTMASRLVPGLFACGEVLDIDGDCGGFNLQWAWSSGRLAGQSAGEERL